MRRAEPRRHREYSECDARVSRESARRARHRAAADDLAGIRASGVSQGRASVRLRRDRRADRPRHDAGRCRFRARRGGREYGDARGLGMQLSVRHDRSDRCAVGDRRRKGRVAARRRVPRRLDAAVGRSAGLSGHSGIRFSSAGRHVDLGRYAQVRLRPEGRLGARVARRELSAPSVFSG